jgi:hypothetical protein
MVYCSTGTVRSQQVQQQRSWQLLQS